MRIGIAFDLAPADLALRLEGPDDRFEEFDKPETVEAIAEVIRGEGHEVALLGDGREFLARVLAEPPDFVFNIAEGEGVGRCRESRVPAVLEMLGIPYSGSDPLTLAACLDKDVANRLVVGSSSVRTPGRLELLRGDRHGYAALDFHFDNAHPATRGEGSDPGPLILKPAFEGSSKGIRAGCVVETKESAFALFEDLSREYDQPIVAEEFIDGDEVTVGLVGNDDYRQRSGPGVLGSMRIIPKRPAGRFVYSLEVKRDWEARVSYEAPPLLPDSLLSALSTGALAAFRALGCRDLARIDFRVRDGVPYFIEANPLPGLAPVTSDLVILARGHGIEYPALIRKVLNAALTRVGLS